jgi:predicted kinase/nicotinic acid mononucleotide adenylyltransferase
MSKAVITWGRLNPVTIGHEKLVNKVESEAKKRGAMPHVFISHSQDAKKNPLDYNTKYNFARKAFGPVVTKSTSKTIIQVLQEVEKMGHNEVVIIVGSDRVSEFKTLTSKYNGKDYTFDKLEVISAGERDPEAEGVSGMSASKMRAVAQAGDYDSFKTGTPSKMSEKDKKAMYDKIRSVMGVNEEIEVDDSDFDISDQELDAFVEMIDLEKLDEESELDEEFETFLEEMELTGRKPLSVSQRIAIGRRMKRLAPKLALKREIAKKKMADKPRLEKRARKAAITALRKKFAGDQGANYASLSPGAKISVDRVIQKKIALVGKLSQKMMPKIRKAEIERLKTVRDSQKEVGTANESFEVYLDEACWDGYKQVGMKKKGDKMVPDCVPEEIIFEDDDQMNTKLLYMLRQAFTNDIERQLIIRALKGGGKSLQNPNLRPFILKLLNRLLDATQQDPTMFNKMKDRLRRMSQADDKEVKEEKRPAKYGSYKPRPGNVLEAQDPDIKDREGTQPAKYHAGLKKSTKAKRDSHFKKMADKPDDQKSTYKPAPGDARAETKPSKHTQKYKAMYGEDVDDAFESFITEEYIEEKALDGLKKKAEKSGISYGILKKVYDRGMAAWKTGHRPGTTPQQWAYARVNSFLTGGKTRTTADADLWKQAKGQKEEVEEARKSPLQRLKDFDKTRAAVGKKPIFKDNEKKKEVNEITLAKLRGKVEKGVMSRSKRNELIQKVKEKGLAAVAKMYDMTPRELQAITESFELDEKVNQSQIDQLEKFADRILAKYDIDVEFTRHFVDRLNDPRNNPEIKVVELQKFFKKIQKNKGKDIKSNPDTQVVLKDLTTNLNLPVVINYKDGEFEVVNKTIMRKKDFKTPDKTIQYEDAVAAAREKIKREKEADKAKHDAMLDRARLQKAQNKNRATESVDEAFESYLEEGINDPAIFKAVFLAGGPGSGKSFVVKKTGLASMGFVVINSDDAFERALKKAGLSTTPEDIFSVQGQEIRGGAKTLTAKRQETVLKGRLGVVVDGTGRDYDKIQKQAQILKDIGYDVGMIFVNTDMETALERNRQRERILPDDQVEKMWKDVQKNMGKFQRFFGQNFQIVDNSIDSNFESEIQSAYKMMGEFAKKTIMNPKAKKWIEQEKKKRGINEAFEGFLEDEHKDCGTPECCGQCPTANTVSESLTEAGGAGEEGTTKLKKKYQDDTPGQTCEEEDWGCWCSEENLLESELQEAEYQGKKVTLNDPVRSSDGKKKFHVYVKNEKDNIIKLGFGDPNMEIKRDDPARRKSFRARHNCSDPGPKWKARYWSCYQWRGSAKVDN